MTTKKTDERDEGKKRDDEKREHTEHAQQGIPKQADDEQNKSPPSINEPPGSDVMPPEVLEEIARQEKEADAQQAARQQKDQKPEADEEEKARDKKHK